MQQPFLLTTWKKNGPTIHPADPFSSQLNDSHSRPAPQSPDTVGLLRLTEEIRLTTWEIMQARK